MICYECERKGTVRSAAGICHNCSIGVCARHGLRVKTLVGHTTGRSFVPGISERELPEEAERFLCRSCADAVAHQHLRKVAA
jgi:hypothetical protein